MSPEVRAQAQWSGFVLESGVGDAGSVQCGRWASFGENRSELVHMPVTATGDKCHPRG